MVLQILVLLVKSNLEDRLVAVRHDNGSLRILEILRILKHREMGKVDRLFADHQHVVSRLGVRGMLLRDSARSPEETQGQQHGNGSDSLLRISQRRSSYGNPTQRFMRRRVTSFRYRRRRGRATWRSR